VFDKTKGWIFIYDPDVAHKEYEALKAGDFVPFLFYVGDGLVFSSSQSLELHQHDKILTSFNV
jgi:hypothetical protein